MSTVIATAPWLKRIHRGRSPITVHMQDNFLGLHDDPLVLKLILTQTACPQENLAM